MTLWIKNLLCHDFGSMKFIFTFYFDLDLSFMEVEDVLQTVKCYQHYFLMLWFILKFALKRRWQLNTANSLYLVTTADLFSSYKLDGSKARLQKLSFGANSSQINLKVTLLKCLWSKVIHTQIWHCFLRWLLRGISGWKCMVSTFFVPSL